MPPHIPVRTVPPYVYQPHEVPDPEPPRSWESAWLPWKRQDERIFGPDPPGTVILTGDQITESFDLDAPSRVPHIRPKTAPVPSTIQAKARKVVMIDWWFPFALRVIQFICCLVAMAVAANLVSFRRRSDQTSTTVASNIMAVTIDAVAVVYLPIIIHIEFWNKPINWKASRNARRLLLDLVFVVLTSVNLALATWVVASRHDDGRAQLSDRQAALAAMLAVALAAWIISLSIAILRLIERVNVRARAGS